MTIDSEITVRIHDNCQLVVEADGLERLAVAEKVLIY